MYDVIVCGGNTVDAFVQSDAELIKISGKDHGRAIDQKLVAYPLGTKILINDLQFHMGGGGTNVLATFAQQGLKSAYIGKIGKDTHGHLVFDWLKKNKITFLGQVGGQTGYSVILDSQADDRTILNFRGSNNDLEFSKIPQHELTTKWFYGCAMLGESYKTLVKLFAFMHNHGVKTAFNPNTIMVEKGIEKLALLLKHTDVLIINTEEAQMLVGVGDTQSLATRLQKYGPSIVAITQGKEGVMIQNNSESFHIAPTRGIKVVETTGAGDAFASGLIAGLIQGRKVREAALLGVLNAESVIQHYGTKEHILSKKEAEKLLQR